MDTRVLLMLVLSGVSFSVAGPVNKYIAVNIPMSWSAAREYCNNTHLALATFTTWADLLMLRAAAGGSTHWIEPNEALETSTEIIPVNPNPWEWSLGSILIYLNFKSGEPVVKCAIGVCVKMESNGTWIDQTCSSLNDFVCFAGPLTDKLYHLVQLKLTWEAARDHCQLYYYDLAVIESAEENEEVLSTLNTLNTSAWIGLYREPWVLSDGCKDVLIYWSPEPEEPSELEITPELDKHPPSGPQSKIEEPTADNLAQCAKLVSGGLSDHDCEDVHPFICNRALKQRRTKITMQSSLDLTNPNAQDNTLLQMSAHLASTGMTDFHLSWSTPPQKPDPTVWKADKDQC
ncbi:unnamed protein product [Gadus morhua 'NCC']